LLVPLSTGRKILVFLLGTLILGAALAPVLFWCSQPLFEIPVLSSLKDTDFSRFFERAVLVAAVILAFPAMRWIGVREFHDLKISWAWRRSWQLPAGFLVAAIVIALWGWFAMKVGLAEFKVRPLWNLIPNLLLTSLSVAVIEELLFRGVILGLIRQTTPTWVSATFVSAIFAIVHPLRPGVTGTESVNWHSGFDLLLQTVQHLGEPLELVSGFLTIFVLGLILAHATIKTGALWLPIGVHAGVVFTKMSFNKLTHHLADLQPWFGPDLTTGCGAIAILLLLWLLVWLLFPRASGPQHSLPNGG
jgi:membrane protease YdiL (CAAX protease family)